MSEAKKKRDIRKLAVRTMKHSKQQVKLKSTLYHIQKNSFDFG